MRWREALEPMTMQRVALLAPRASLRDVLVDVADEGTLALDAPATRPGARSDPGPASRRLRRLRGGEGHRATLARRPPDLDACETTGRVDLIAGEAELERRAGEAVVRGHVAGLVGWIPAHDVAHLAGRVAPHGGAVAPLPRPPGVQPPTLLSPTGAARGFAPLVETYATVPYADLNPSVVAGLAYVAMFGMMFADVGHGALLTVVALACRTGRWSPLERLRPVWLFLAGAGVASMVVGALYGEFFGPTGVLTPLWLSPLDHPIQLLAAGIAVGGVLLAGAYALGIVNRFREGGWRRAAYAPSGLAGATLFLGVAAVAGGAWTGTSALTAVGATLTGAGVVASYAGLLAAAGGGAGGAAEAAVELVDVLVRIGSNLVSFARLAAFGLTHAALGAVVWEATGALWSRGGPTAAAAVAVFVLGNAVAFALEGLVAAIQALRLEYYELFSRVFDGEGEPFLPWHVPTDPLEASR